MIREDCALIISTWSGFWMRMNNTLTSCFCVVEWKPIAPIILLRNSHLDVSKKMGRNVRKFHQNQLARCVFGEGHVQCSLSLIELNTTDSISKWYEGKEKELIFLASKRINLSSFQEIWWCKRFLWNISKKNFENLFGFREKKRLGKNHIKNRNVGVIFNVSWQ